MADPYAAFSSPENADPYAAFSSVAAQGGAPAPAPESLSEEIWNGLNTGVNYLGTQTAKLASGALGLPHMVGTAARTIIDKTNPDLARVVPMLGALRSWENTPSGGDYYGTFKNSTGAPEVNLAGHIPGGAAIDAGVQGVVGSALTGGTSLPSILAGFGAGAVPEGAGDVAHEFDRRVGTNIEPYARIGGGVAGALLGHTLGSLPGYTASILKGGLVPFTEGGRDLLVGRALNTIADDPQTAARNMAAYSTAQDAFPSATPGFGLSAAKASRDDSLLATENALSNPGSGFGALAKSNNAALSAALDRVMAGGDPKQFVAELAKQDAGAAMRAQAALDALPPGTNAATAGLAIQNALRGRYDALVSARKEATDPLYAAARNSDTPVNAFPLMSSTADALAATKGAPNATVGNVRSLLFKTNENGALIPDRTAAGMMATRSAIGDMLDNPMLPNYQRSLLTGFKNQAEDALSAVPEEQAARQTFAKLSQPLEPFDANLGNQNAAATIAKDRFGKDFLMEPDLVPGRFFRPGDAGSASMREFFETQPSPQARDAMASFIAQKAREAADPQAFLKTYGPAIDTMPPQLGQRIRDAVTTGNLAEGFRASPAGKFLGNDLDSAVRSTLGAPDSARRMAALRMSVGGNPDAVAGLQRAVLDDFKRAASSSVQTDAAGNPMLSANGAAKWLEANGDTAARALTPDQMNVLKTVVGNLKDEAQTAVRTAGSDTGRNLATRSLLDAVLGPFSDKLAGIPALKKALGFAYGGADQRTMERLVEVMQNPRLASALMMKASPGNAKLAQPLITSILRGAAIPAMTVQ